jgi:hypothetical protein
MPTATVNQNQFVPYDPSYGMSEADFNAAINQRNALSNPGLVTYNPTAVSTQTQQAQTPTGGVGETYNQGTGGGGGGAPDLSNPVKQWEYAQGLGFDNWQQYLDSLNQPSWEDQQRNEINSGWDAYTNQLNDMLNNNLPDWRSSQEQVAQGSQQSAMNELGIQKGSSERALAEQQTKNLRDLSGNIRNLFEAGNIYLGARGAGDSSASNMYSYALTKLGNQARGDIQSQVASRQNQIRDIYNSENNRLQSELNTRMGQIADWFNNARMQLKSQLGEAGLGRSQDLQALSNNILNVALSNMQTLQQENANRRASLDSWALSNSQNASQLTNNMRTVQQMPGYQGLTGGQPLMSGSGGLYIPGGYGYSGDEERR